MRTNKAILDEATRSIRRTFLGSIAGSVGMMGVIGAAGAYGMPERLSTQALTEAFSTLHARFSPAVSAPAMVRARINELPRTAAAVMPVPDHGAMPPAMDVPALAPVVAPVEAPAVAPVEVAIAAAPVVTIVEPPKPAGAAAGRAVLTAPPAETPPAPVITASLPEAAAVVAPPEVIVAPQPSFVATPEAPVAPPQAAPSAPPVEVRNTVEVPKTVWVMLPHPKPPLSPAQRLDLQGKDYEKAERCLAQAIYFEARNEPARGQQAVAQVVLNRVFSPYYPKDVCSVVYQNAHRHLSCQFTFACDGKPEAIRERGAWARATRIAKQTLDAQIWLPEVNKATHYHAAYVRPNWIRDMRVMVRYGLHTFYRPRNWGDGSKEHSWGHGPLVAAKKGRNS